MKKVTAYHMAYIGSY